MHINSTHTCMIRHVHCTRIYLQVCLISYTYLRIYIHTLSYLYIHMCYHICICIHRWVAVFLGHVEMLCSNFKRRVIRVAHVELEFDFALSTISQKSALMPWSVVNRVASWHFIISAAHHPCCARWARILCGTLYIFSKVSSTAIVQVVHWVESSFENFCTRSARI